MPITRTIMEVICPGCQFNIVFEDDDNILQNSTNQETIDIYKNNDTSVKADPENIPQKDAHYNQTVTVSFKRPETATPKSILESTQSSSSAILRPQIAKAKKLGSFTAPAPTVKGNSQTHEVEDIQPRKSRKKKSKDKHK